MLVCRRVKELAFACSAVLHSFGDFSWKGSSVIDKAGSWTRSGLFKAQTQTDDKKISERSGPQWLPHPMVNS